MSLKFCLKKLVLYRKLWLLLFIVFFSSSIFFLRTVTWPNSLREIKNTDKNNETDSPPVVQKLQNDAKRVKRQVSLPSARIAERPQQQQQPLTKFPLRIQGFKSPYEQNLVLDSFLDQHEVVTSYPESISDGENLLYTLRLKWREQFYLPKFVLLIFPTLDHHLGQELWAQSKALLAERPKIVLMDENKNQIEPNSNWTGPQNLVLDYWKSRNYKTVFRLQKPIKLDIMGPMVLIERKEATTKMDNFWTNSSSSSSSSKNRHRNLEILDHHSYQFNNHDNRAVELTLFAGVTKAHAHVDEILQWEVGLVLTNFTAQITTTTTTPPPAGDKENDDDSTQNPTDLTTTSEDIFDENATESMVLNSTQTHNHRVIESWEKNKFLYKITPKFLTLDQLTLRYHLLEEKGRQNAKAAHSLLLINPANEALLETAGKMRKIASEIRPLRRALGLLKRLETFNENSVSVTSLKNPSLPLTSPQNKSEESHKMAVDSLNIDDADANRHLLIGRERLATAVILGEGGKSMFEILTQLKVLDDLYKSLKADKDHLFHLDGESVQKKRDNLNDQRLLLTNWIQLHQEQNEFVLKNFPGQVHELEEIEIDGGHQKWPMVQNERTRNRDNNWTLDQIYEIEKEKIALETDLLDPKMELAQQVHKNRTASTIPVLRDKVTLLTQKFEIANVKFVKSRREWDQINRLRAHFLVLLLTRTTNNIQCTSVPTFCDPNHRLSGQSDFREMNWEKVDRVAKKDKLIREFMNHSFVRKVTSPSPFSQKQVPLPPGVKELEVKSNQIDHNNNFDQQEEHNDNQKGSKYGLDLDDLLRMMEDQSYPKTFQGRDDDFVKNFFAGVEHGLVHHNVSIFLGSKTFLRRTTQRENERPENGPADHDHRLKRLMHHQQKNINNDEQKLPLIMDRLVTDSGEPFYASIARNFQKSTILMDATNIAILGRLTGIIQDENHNGEKKVPESWRRHRSWKVNENEKKDKKRRRRINTNVMTKWLILAGHVTSAPAAGGNIKSFWDPNIVQTGFAMDHLVSIHRRGGGYQQCTPEIGKNEKNPYQKDDQLRTENNFTHYFCPGRKSWAHIGLLTPPSDKMKKLLIVYKPISSQFSTQWNNLPQLWDQGQNWYQGVSRMYPRIKILDKMSLDDHPASDDDDGSIPDMDGSFPFRDLNDNGPQLTKFRGPHYHSHRTSQNNNKIDHHGDHPPSLYWAHFIPTKMANGVQQIPDNMVRVRFSDWGQRHVDNQYVNPEEFTFEKNPGTQPTDALLPIGFDNFNLFCRPLLTPSALKGKGKHGSKLVHTHHCENAVGIRLQRKTSVKNLYALFRLGEGKDEIVGFQNLPNYFEVGPGHKNFTGGSARDIFLIQNGFTGILNGVGMAGPEEAKTKENTLILSNDLNATLVQLVNHWPPQPRSRQRSGQEEKKKGRRFEQKLVIDGQTATVVMMTDVVGRENLKDVIEAACHTKTIDGHGGRGRGHSHGHGQVDEILVPNMICGDGQQDEKKLENAGEAESGLYQLEIEVRGATNITNEYDGGAAIFLYNLENLKFTKSSKNHTLSINQPSTKNERDSHLTIFTPATGHDKRKKRAYHVIRLNEDSASVNFCVDSLILPPFNRQNIQNDTFSSPIRVRIIEEDGFDLLSINLKNGDRPHDHQKQSPTMDPLGPLHRHLDPQATLTIATLDDENFMNFIQHDDGRYTLKINVLARNSSLVLKTDANGTSQTTPAQSVRIQNGKVVVGARDGGGGGGVELNFDHVSPSNSMIQTLTADEAKIILVKGKSMMAKDFFLVPKFYFFVTTTTNNNNNATKTGTKTKEEGVVHGSEVTQNVFDVPEGGSFHMIFGGKMVDHFRLERPSPLHRPLHSVGNFQTVPTIFSSNTTTSSSYNNQEDGDDIIEIGKSGGQRDQSIENDVCSIDFTKNQIIWKDHDHPVNQKKSEGSIIRLEGSFEIILGREEAADNLTVGCHVKYVDLKGGVTQGREWDQSRSPPFVLPGQNNDKNDEEFKFVDVVTIPNRIDAGNCVNPLIMKIQIRETTRIENFYDGPGQFLYHVMQRPNPQPLGANTNKGNAMSKSHKSVNDPSWGHQYKSVIMLKDSVTQNLRPSKRTHLIQIDYLVTQLDLNVVQGKGVKMGQNGYPKLDILRITSVDQNGGNFVRGLNLEIHAPMEALASANTNTNIMTADGVRITVFKKDGKFHPAFQFQLDQSKVQDDHEKKIVTGSLILPNHFILMAGQYHHDIVGGHVDDHFQILDSNIHINRLDAGPSGVDVLEIGNNLETTSTFHDLVTIDLQAKFVRTGESGGAGGAGVQNIFGDFEHIYGRQYAPEHVTPTCSIRSIDLGGSSDETGDQISVPPSSSLCPSYDLAMKIYPNTKVLVEGGGKFLYHFQNPHHHHHLDHEQVKWVIDNGTRFNFFSNSPAPNSTHSTVKLMNGLRDTENTILLDYAANELEAELVVVSGIESEWLIGSTKGEQLMEKNRHDLHLILNDWNILKNLVVGTRDGAQIILGDSKTPEKDTKKLQQPSFLFDIDPASLSENSQENNPIIIRGAERNQNNFFAKGTTTIGEILGGTLQDRFVIDGAVTISNSTSTNMTTTYLNGGGGTGEDILEISDYSNPPNNDLITSFDLVEGKIVFSNGVSIESSSEEDDDDGSTGSISDHSLTLQGDTFKHFVGRVNGTDRLIASCQTRTVNLGEKGLTSQRRQLSIPDHILVPPSTFFVGGQPNCVHNLVVQCGNDTSTIIFNGGDRGKVYIKVDTVAGYFSLYTLRHHHSTELRGDKGKNFGKKFRAPQIKENDEQQQMVSIYNLNISFFDLKDIEVDPTNILVTLRHGPQKFQASVEDQDSDQSEAEDEVDGRHEELAHFQTFQLDSASQMIQIFESMTHNTFNNEGHSQSEEEGEDDQSVKKQVKKKNLSLPHSHSYQNDGGHGDDEEDEQGEEEENVIPVPKIKFPTFYTADNYQIKINHVGGLHVLYTDRASSSSSSKSINDLIRDHVHLVNSLGVTLIISVVKNWEKNEQTTTAAPGGTGLAEGEEDISAMIYMGGDDELDLLMNHPDIESHLVAAGEGCIFKIFPSGTQPDHNQPVFIYLAKPRWHHPHQQQQQQSDREFQSNEPSPPPLDLDAGMMMVPSFGNDGDPTSFKMGAKNEGKKYRLSLDAFVRESWRQKFIHGGDDEYDRLDIPKIVQEKNDLRIFVPYYIPVINATTASTTTNTSKGGQTKIDQEEDEEEEEEEEEKVFQEIVLVNGLHHFDQLEVTLGTVVWHIKKVYRESSIDSQNWKWVLEAQNLILNPPLIPSIDLNDDDPVDIDDDNEALGSNEQKDMRRKSRHVIMSAEDLVDYRKFQIPLILNRPVNRPQTTLYRNGTTLICTNGVDPSPPFQFDWYSPSFDYSVQARTVVEGDESQELFSFVLLDIRAAMETENFSLILDVQDHIQNMDPSTEDGGSKGKDNGHEPSTIVTISIENFDALKDYSMAVEEMERKIFWNHLSFWAIFILIVMACLVLLGGFLVLVYGILVKFCYSGYSIPTLFPNGSLAVKEGGGIKGKGKYFKRKLSSAESSSTASTAVVSTNQTAKEIEALSSKNGV